MTVGPEYETALRAFLVDLDGEPLNRLGVGCPEQDMRLGTLISFALAATARVRFASGCSREDVIRYVARTRTKYGLGELAPSLAENMLALALGQGPVPAESDQAKISLAQLALLKSLADDLGPDALNRALEEARRIASLRLEQQGSLLRAAYGALIQAGLSEQSRQRMRQIIESACQMETDASPAREAMGMSCASPWTRMAPGSSARCSGRAPGWGSRTLSTSPGSGSTTGNSGLTDRRYWPARRPQRRGKPLDFSVRIRELAIRWDGSLQHGVSADHLCIPVAGQERLPEAFQLVRVAVLGETVFEGTPEFPAALLLNCGRFLLHDAQGTEGRHETVWRSPGS